MEDDILEEKDKKQRKKPLEEFVHKINMDVLVKELHLQCVEDVGNFVGLRNPKGAYYWAKDKAEGGTRPPFNAIAKLLVQGATVETLFGVEYNKIHGFGGKIKITNEDISNAMLVAAELLRNQKNENSTASENNESVDDVNDSIENG